MPLSTESLLTMDYVYNGQPFVYIPAKYYVDLKTLDYAYNAQPFAGVDSNTQIFIPKVMIIM